MDQDPILSVYVARACSRSSESSPGGSPGRARWGGARWWRRTRARWGRRIRRSARRTAARGRSRSRRPYRPGPAQPLKTFGVTCAPNIKMYDFLNHGSYRLVLPELRRDRPRTPRRRSRRCGKPRPQPSARPPPTAGHTSDTPLVEPVTASIRCAYQYRSNLKKKL